MKVLVTGGRGFLGQAIVAQCVKRGDDVTSFSRGLCPKLENWGVRQLRGDLANEKEVVDAARGCDLVFHVAAKAGVWGSFEEYYRPNVLGTQNVLNACKHLNVSRLVYTSSPSVVFNGSDMQGVDESTPYAAHFDAYYPQSKAEAEMLVLKANGKDLSTVALRPHLIWGPGDTHLIPRIVARGRAGSLRRIGPGNNLVDTIYVDNAAEAHLLAADCLRPGSKLAGKAYFVSQGEPVRLWDFVDQILEAAGVEPIRHAVSPRLAYTVGWLFEIAYRAMRSRKEPPMTRFLARELATSHWFDISAARRDFGYKPRITISQGMRLLQEDLARREINPRPKGSRGTE